MTILLTTQELKDIRSELPTENSTNKDYSEAYNR